MNIFKVLRSIIYLELLNYIKRKIPLNEKFPILLKLFFFFRRNLSILGIKIKNQDVKIKNIFNRLFLCVEKISLHYSNAVQILNFLIEIPFCIKIDIGRRELLRGKHSHTL